MVVAVCGGGGGESRLSQKIEDILCPDTQVWRFFSFSTSWLRHFRSYVLLYAAGSICTHFWFRVQDSGGMR